MTAYAQPMADPTNVSGRRIGAWFIDLAIFLAVLFGVLISTNAFTIDTDRTFATSTEASNFCDDFQDEESNRFCSTSGRDVVTVEVDGSGNLIWLGHLAAYIVIQGLAGGSLGKLAVGLRVVDEHGNQAGMLKSLIRTVLWVVDAVTIGLPIVGGILILSTKGHRRLGDMAAGTYVIPVSQMGRPVAIAGVNAPLGPPGAPGGWGSPPAPGGGWGSPPTASGTGAWGVPDTGQQAGWAPPGTSQPPAPGAVPASDGPTWDAARDTYIQYDRDRSAWLQWDEGRNEWRPIDQ